MAIVELAPRALNKFHSITEYLLEVSPDKDAPKKFAQLIRTALDDLANNPFMAGFSSIIGEGKYRELTVKATKARAYRLLYKYDEKQNLVTVLAMKDAREQGYEGYF